MRYIWITIILASLIVSTLLVTKQVQADWTYTVKRGDTIYRIATKTGVSVDKIKAKNGYPSSLRIGQRLIIPTGGNSGTVTRVSGDSYLLARVIHAEAGSEPYLGKVAVGGVILNRIQNPKFPKTLSGVIYQPYAFESVSNGMVNRSPGGDSLKAARDALSGWDPSGGALYFFNPSKTSNRWIWARQIINRIGKHVFAI